MMDSLAAFCQVVGELISLNSLDVSDNFTSSSFPLAGLDDIDQERFIPELLSSVL